MNIGIDAKKIVAESENKSQLDNLLDWLVKYLTAEKIFPTELQWAILTNHLDEMIKRSKEGIELPEVERELFSDVSKESLEISKNIIDKVSGLNEDEAYVLSIHFEVAKQN